MTDGTSQGLFIVVAIVIFGIFVVLAYILFEDTLSPALASMFHDATEQAQDRLLKSESLFTTADLKIWDQELKDFKILDSRSFEITRTGKSGFLPLSVPIEKVPDKNEIYTMSGYMFVDGVPANEIMWVSKGFSNAQKRISFRVDPETGYFESTMKLDYFANDPNPDNSIWFRRLIFHTDIRNVSGSFAEGEVILVKDFKFQKGDKAIR